MGVSQSSNLYAKQISEEIVRPLEEVWKGMEAKLKEEDDYGSIPFILHRRQWEGLVRLYRQIMANIKKELAKMLTPLVTSLGWLFFTMEAARKSLEECIAPHARGYNFRLQGSSTSNSGGDGGRGVEEEEYVWTGLRRYTLELGYGDAEELEQRIKREDLRLWMAKHALTHILDREIPYLHADNFRISSLAVIMHLLNPCHSPASPFPSVFDIKRMMMMMMDCPARISIDRDDREARAFFGDKEILREIDISKLLLCRLRDEMISDENVEAIVERLSVHKDQFRKCDSASGKLGKGGFGSVKLRKWVSDNHDVAMKKGNFGCQEITIQARVRHPNLLPLLCCCSSTTRGGGTEQMMMFHAIVMERMDFSLDKLLMTGQTDILKMEMMLQIAKGMANLHSQNIIHRDLKPPNILVSGYPHLDYVPDWLRLPFLRVKVADFGTSKDNFRTAHPSNTHKVGTGLYRAPEVLVEDESDAGYSRKADVYSFAMVCYGIITGKESFHGDRRPHNILRNLIQNEALRPKFHQFYPWPALVGMVEECWQPDASRRPNFAQIAEFLRLIKVCAQTSHSALRHKGLFREFIHSASDHVQMLFSLCNKSLHRLPSS